MDEPEGERMNMPVPFSQVETTYKKGEARIDVKIVDTGFAQMLMAPWSMMLASGYSRETSSGYEKATTLSGNPAIEKWDKGSKNGELDVLVGKRFMVTHRRARHRRHEAAAGFRVELQLRRDRGCEVEVSC